MAASNSAGFSLREGAALPTDLGIALTEQLARLFRRAPAAPDSLASSTIAGPSFAELTPDLAGELRGR